MMPLASSASTWSLLPSALLRVVGFLYLHDADVARLARLDGETLHQKPGEPDVLTRVLRRRFSGRRQPPLLPCRAKPTRCRTDAWTRRRLSLPVCLRFLPAGLPRDHLPNPYPEYSPEPHGFTRRRGRAATPRRGP